MSIGIQVFVLCVGGDADFHPVGLCFEVFATEYAATCCVAAGVWECGEVSVRDDSEWPADDSRSVRCLDAG